MPIQHPDSPTRQRVSELLGKGLSVREVAAILQISTQRVYQHKAALIDAAKARHPSA